MLSSVLRLGVPAVLLCVAIFRIGRSPAYVLLLPITYEFGRAAYLDTYGVSFGGFGSDLVGVGLLVACSLLLLVLRRPAEPTKAFSFMGGLIGLLVCWMAAVAVFSAAEGLQVGKAVLTALFSMSFPLSCLAWIAALSRVSEDELLGLVETVAVITGALSVLYALQAVGVPVYPYAQYSSVFIGDRVFVRDFLTFPFFAVPIALAWASAKRGMTGARTFVAVACIVAVASTFTRSIVLAALIALVVPAAILVLERRGEPTGSGFPVVAVAVISALVVVGASALDQYWSVRLSGGLQDVSVVGRIAAIENNVRGSSLVDALVGYGYGGDIPVAPGVVLGDSLWIGWVYRFGLIGMFLLVAAFFGAMADALRSVGRSSPTRRTLGAVAAALPLAVLMLTFAGVPSSLNVGFSLAMGPALLLGAVQRAAPVAGSRVDAWALAPAWARTTWGRGIAVAVGVILIGVIEVWLGTRLGRW